MTKTESDFCDSLNIMKRYVYNWAKHKGFWEGSQDNTGQKIALMHSELSEALESVRNGLANFEMSDKIEGFSGLEEEMADLIIRVLDFSGRHNLRIGEAIVAKMAYNEKRPYKHGKKF